LQANFEGRHVMKFKRTRLLLMALFLAIASTALASTTWYVNGVSGSDSNNCISALTACKTIGHAISLVSSGDSIMVAAATYAENLTIGVSLRIVGSGARTTIVDGGGVNTVVTISNTKAHVSLSNVTVRAGHAPQGGGMYNNGTLTVSNSTLSGNSALGPVGSGGGIQNNGTLTINNSTLSGNTARGTASGGFGGGISNAGTATISNTTFTSNSVSGVFGAGFGGGIGNGGTATISNSTFTGNNATAWGGGIGNEGNLTINNSTISGNQGSDGGIANYYGTTTLQNSIAANNSGGDCGFTITSNGYNLSSDGSCNFNNTGDLNNTDPKLGPLQNNGGPTQTMALLSGSPAIDAGNPSGCTNGRGRLLKTDQRGKPRPDKEDTGGCDMGAYESQSD
jgi:hypothetical protein